MRSEVNTSKKRELNKCPTELDIDIIVIVVISHSTINNFSNVNKKYFSQAFFIIKSSRSFANSFLQLFSLNKYFLRSSYFFSWCFL